MPRRRAAAVVAVVLAAGGLVAAGSSATTQRLDASTGAAWLASDVGIVTLLDGASEEVVGSVRVAPRSVRLRTQQLGSSAFVLDESRGSVVRVDGATYATSDAVQFTGGPSRSMHLLVGPQAVHVVDGERRLAAVADPQTLKLRHAPVPLAAEPGAQQAVVDDHGRLVMVDGASGDLVMLEAAGTGDRETARQATSRSSRVLLAGGRAVVLDEATGTAGAVADDALDPLECRPRVPAAEQVRWTGSTRPHRLYGSSATAGLLYVIDLDQGADCLRTVRAGRAGDRLGAVVEAFGLAFVPNLTRGHARVLDPARGELLAEVDLRAPDAPVELVATSAAVFYNDPASSRAGVIRLEDGRWTAREVAKYDEQDPGRNLLDRADATSKPKRPDTPPKTAPPTTQDSPDESTPLPPSRPTAPPTTSPTDTPPTGAPITDPTGPSGTDPPGTDPPGTDPPGTDPPEPPATDPPSTTDPPTKVDAPRLLLDVQGTGTVAVSPWPAAVEEGTPEWCEDVGPHDPGPGCVFTYPADGSSAQVTLTATPGSGQRAVWSGCGAEAAASQCTLDLGAGDTTVTVVFEAIPRPSDVTLTLGVADGDGALKARNPDGTERDCSSGCPYPPATVVPLIARPAAGSYLSSWGVPGCTDPGKECSVTVDSDISYSATFTKYPVLTVLVTGGGTVRGTGSRGGDWFCSGRCPIEYAKDAEAVITADDHERIPLWTKDCAGPCRLKMGGDRLVQVDFVDTGCYVFDPTLLTVHDAEDIIGDEDEVRMEYGGATFRRSMTSGERADPPPVVFCDSDSVTINIYDEDVGSIVSDPDDHIGSHVAAVRPLGRWRDAWFTGHGAKYQLEYTITMTVRP